MTEFAHKKRRLHVRTLGCIAILGVNVAISFVLVAVVFLCAELWARRSPIPTRTEHFWADNTESNTLLGYRLKRNTKAREFAVQGDRPLYDVRYTIGENGWRVVPQVDSDPYGSCDREFLAVFGGSYAYGHGLEDDGTVSAHLAKEFPRFTPYLFAAGGYGTANVYEIIRSGELDSVRESRGVGLYILITAHLDRVEGTLNTSRWAQNYPYYRIIGGGAATLFLACRGIAVAKLDVRPATEESVPSAGEV